MRYTQRRHTSTCLGGPDDLVAIFAQQATWTTCTAFEITYEGVPYLFANDSTGTDGTQEYTVARIIDRSPDAYLVQEVESLSISWLSGSHDIRHALLRAITSTTTYGMPHWIPIDPPSVRHRCPACA